MRAATIRNGELVVEEHPDPEPGTGEVLIRVRAAGVNAGDLIQQAGRYPAPPGWPPDIPGLELAGEIIATGPNAFRFTGGERVMAVVGGGGQAELAVAHERTVIAVPDRLSWAEAGGAPEVLTTAHDALFTQCDLKSGERLLVHGAAGGVGTAAVQLGAAVGAHVTATVRNTELREGVRELGASVVLGVDGFESNGPFDVVLELVGAPNLEANIQALAPWGRISVIGVGAGVEATLNFPLLMSRRGTIRGSTLRPRPLEEKVFAAQAIESHVVPLLASGAVRIPLAETFPLSEVSAAYGRFAAGGKLGKIVLTMD
jgi:NADPH:quinone reductase-like Zn-dependent oxidoreductase